MRSVSSVLLLLAGKRSQDVTATDLINRTVELHLRVESKQYKVESPLEIKIPNDAIKKLEKVNSNIVSLISAYKIINANIKELTKVIPSLKNTEEKLEGIRKALADQNPCQVEVSCPSPTENQALGFREWILAGSVIVALISFFVTSLRQLQYKRVDTMLEFAKRYHELFTVDPVFLPEQGPPTKENWLKFQRQHFLFWSIQHQQFSTWRKGLIPHPTYKYWMTRRIMENKNQDALGFIDWKTVRERFECTHYYDFMKDLLPDVEPPVQFPPGMPDEERNRIKQQMAMERANTILWKHMHWLFKVRFFFIQKAFPEGVFSYFLSWNWRWPKPGHFIQMVIVFIILLVLFIGVVLAGVKLVEWLIALVRSS